MEPSTVSGLSVEGSALDVEPSMMRGVFVEGSGRRREPSTISGLSVDGSALDAEPSMMRGIFVEGSGLGNGTFHDFGLQRGWFRPTACSAQQLRANTRERGYCRRWLWTGFADSVPGPGYAPMLAAERRARLQYAPHRMLAAERRMRLQIAITAACSLNNMSDCNECSATTPNTRMPASR